MEPTEIVANTVLLTGRRTKGKRLHKIWIDEDTNFRCSCGRSTFCDVGLVPLYQCRVFRCVNCCNPYKVVTPEPTEFYKQERTMSDLNRQHFAEFFRADFYVVEVYFPSSNTHGAPKLYNYKVPNELPLVENDRVFVCPSNDMDTTEEIRTAVVRKINNEAYIDGKANFELKWIVGRFDDVMSNYIDNLQKDQNIKRAVAKLEVALAQVDLKQRMSVALQQIDEASRNEILQLFGGAFTPSPTLEHVKPEDIG